MDIGRQSKKWENEVLNGESGTASLLKEVSTHSSIDNVDKESESISLHFKYSNLFQPNAEASMGCPNDAAMCKSVEQSRSGSNEEISSYSIGKLKGSPPSFTYFIDDESKNLLESRLSLGLIWSIVGGILQDKYGKPLPLVGSWTHFNMQMSCKIFQKSLIKYMLIITESVTDFGVFKSYLCFLVEVIENLEIKRILSYCNESVYSKLLQNHIGNMVMSSPKLSHL